VLVAEFEEKTYAFEIGSDVGRDGMYVEVKDTTGSTDEVVAEVFCPFEKQAMLLTLWREYVPIEVIDEAVRIAREQKLIRR
jgi:hypothetical protein